MEGSYLQGGLPKDVAVNINIGFCCTTQKKKKKAEGRGVVSYFYVFLYFVIVFLSFF